jgi:hypothetical protein
MDAELCVLEMIACGEGKRDRSTVNSFWQTDETDID